MDYIFENNNADITLVLFHGTGGSKDDLIPLARMIDKTANILSLEGQVEESGMKRFFKRKRPGVFDEEDLERRVETLKGFLDDVAKEKNLKREHFVMMGYSNGANIVGAMLYHFTKPYRGALLLHPMIPYQDKELITQENLPVFIGAGNNDPMCPSEETMAWAKKLNEAKATVDIHWHASGHQLTQSELDAAKYFYDEHIK